MITNDAELAVVRRQLGNAEAALDSLRRDVKPKNERTYNVMAESYIDMLLSLRADIDTYLGIAPGQLPTTVVEGVIRCIDVECQTFVLRERPFGKSDLPCEYVKQLEDVVQCCKDRRVRATGGIETSRTTRRERMAVEAIEPITSEKVPPNGQANAAGDERTASPCANPAGR